MSHNPNIPASRRSSPGSLYNRHGGWFLVVGLRHGHPNGGWPMDIFLSADALADAIAGAEDLDPHEREEIACWGVNAPLGSAEAHYCLAVVVVDGCQQDIYDTVDDDALQAWCAHWHLDPRADLREQRPRRDSFVVVEGAGGDNEVVVYRADTFEDADQYLESRYGIEEVDELVVDILMQHADGTLTTEF